MLIKWGFVFSINKICMFLHSRVSKMLVAISATPSCPNRKNSLISWGTNLDQQTTSAPSTRNRSKKAGRATEEAHLCRETTLGLDDPWRRTSGSRRWRIKSVFRKTVPQSCVVRRPTLARKATSQVKACRRMLPILQVNKVILLNCQWLDHPWACKGWVPKNYGWWTVQILKIISLELNENFNNYFKIALSKKKIKGGSLSVFRLCKTHSSAFVRNVLKNNISFVRLKLLIRFWFIKS